MEHNGVKMAFGITAVGFAFLILSSLDSKLSFTSAAGYQPAVPTVARLTGNPLRQKGALLSGRASDAEFTRILEHVESEPIPHHLTLGSKPLGEEHLLEEAEGIPISHKAGVFNVLATSFFAALSYFRRKAAMVEEECQPVVVSIATVSGSAAAEETPNSGLAKLWKFLTSFDYSLFLCLVFWYVGNYHYNISNKLALKATGGVAGAPLTIASLQLFVGVLYGLFLWVAPDARKFPNISLQDVKNMVPLSIAFAGAHFSTVFSMSAGAVSFGQIVKASEPAFAALLGVILYSQKVSTAKWLSLIPVIGGVCLASAAELDFSVAALIAGILANLFAAVKGNENKKAMDTPGLKDRLGNVGNQFAMTMCLSWLLSLPLVLLAEWKQLPGLLHAWKSNPVVSSNTISAGLWFYLYNELATIVVKKTGAVTQSVANTAKRVIVIVACGLVLGESLDTLKLVGCAIGILGVFLYSIIDDLVKGKPKPAA